VKRPNITSARGPSQAADEALLAINARPHQISGVMPAHFRFGGDPYTLVPLQIDPARSVPEFRHPGIARLKEGVTPAQANADVDRRSRSGAWPQALTGPSSATRGTLPRCGQSRRRSSET
jgi:hypothetical protein